jgi:RNA polymerase-binding transcription factor DksA
MTRTDLATFRELLRAKQIELSGKSLSLERIVIERSANELEEAEYKSLSEMAIAPLNRESEMRRSIELALRRITDRRFGVCVHCGEEVKRRRLEVCPGPHSASAVRKRPIAAKRVFSKVSSRPASAKQPTEVSRRAGLTRGIEFAMRKNIFLGAFRMAMRLIARRFSCLQFVLWRSRCSDRSPAIYR